VPQPPLTRAPRGPNSGAEFGEEEGGSSETSLLGRSAVREPPPSGFGGGRLDLAERKATELGEGCARRGRGRDRGWGCFFRARMMVGIW
jgi:hypothetical protein